jgi:hypothetical protein
VSSLEPPQHAKRTTCSAGPQQRPACRPRDSAAVAVCHPSGDAQNRCLHEIERLQAADRSYIDEGVQLLELARNAQRLFAKQEAREKRQLLNFLLSNCTWEDGELVATFRQPFDLLAETAVTAANADTGETAKTAKTEIWPEKVDSNPRCADNRTTFSRPSRSTTPAPLRD